MLIGICREVESSDNTREHTNREAYLELVMAGIMHSVSGPEAYFRFTDEGWERRDEWMESLRENGWLTLQPRLCTRTVSWCIHAYVFR